MGAAEVELRIQSLELGADVEFERWAAIWLIGFVVVAVAVVPAAAVGGGLALSCLDQAPSCIQLVWWGWKGHSYMGKTSVIRGQEMLCS